MTAVLAARSGGETFTVSGWTGRGSLSGKAPGIVTASKSSGFTLTSTSLSSTDGMTLGLSGITTANLTTTATSGSPSHTVDASAFTGVTNLTAGGTVNAFLYGGPANGSTLSATGSGKDVLIGGSGKATLTDSGTGYNILIGGPGVDTITGNGNDILISGTTSYDSNTSANLAALDAILAEWSSSDSYSLRISKIMEGVGPGGRDALNSSTCQSDGVANTVSDGPSGPQNNWFIVNAKDKVTKKSNETETIV
jgi:Ca2+-binding RTX toxin-like protein